MTGYTLTFRRDVSTAFTNGSLLRPDTLGALPADELARLPLPVGRMQVPLSELMDISGAPGPDLTLRMESHPPLNHLGALMRQGQLHIEGDAGDDLGASMTGGVIRVTGNAGHRAGGPHPTSKRGMTGGQIIVEGDAGDYVGLLMRRGLIAVRGVSGASAGYRMLAGTIVIGQANRNAQPRDEAAAPRVIDHPGLEMQRGTVLCLDPAAALATGPGFAAGGTIDAGAMPALLVALKQVPWADLKQLSRGRWNVHIGDALEQNKGEVMQWQSGT